MGINDLLKLVAEGWELIGKLVRQGRKLDDAARVLDAIERVVETVKNASDRKVTLTTAQRELKTLMDEIAANDDAVDQAIADKFPKGED